MDQKISPLSQPIELLDRDTELKKIKANDCFPCFQCFDQRSKRYKCKVCNAQGYLKGDHPMVQFVEQFIEKKIKIANNSQMKNSSLLSQQQGNRKSLNAQQSQLTKQKIDMPKIVQSQSFRQDDDLLGITQSNYVRQSTNDPENYAKDYNKIQHIGFYCDECGVDPIVGPRYSCKTCKDFDLCKKCHEKTTHEHEMAQIQKINLTTKPRAQLLQSLRASMHKSRR